MIKLMLIAGSKTDELADFLTQRGTFVVDFKYQSLNSAADSVLSSIIKVDKFVYVYNVNTENASASTNIRSDMQVLQNMLTHNGFFSAGEFIFLTGTGEVESQAKKYFSAVMSGCNIQNFSIHALDSLASFSSIYDSLIGITQNKDFKNSYRKLYRMSRDDDAIMAYEPRDDRAAIIEPFDFERMRAWDDRMANAVNLESQDAINDGDETEHSTLNNPDFGSAEVQPLQDNRDFIVITGSGKTGKATWAVQLANAAIQCKRSVLLLDCTASQHCVQMASDNGIQLALLTPADAIHQQVYQHDSICSFYSKASLIAFLRYVRSNACQAYQTIILSIDDCFASEALEILGKDITQLIDLIHPFAYDVTHACQLVGAQPIPVFVALSICFSVTDYGVVALSDIKGAMPKATIINSFKFTGFDNKWLYQKIVRR